VYLYENEGGSVEMIYMHNTQKPRGGKPRVNFIMGEKGKGMGRFHLMNPMEVNLHED
jgi:hypothetical protein